MVWQQTIGMLFIITIIESREFIYKIFHYVFINCCGKLFYGNNEWTDAADAGYKVDLQRLKDISAQINPDGDKIFTLSLLIPIFNMINVLCRTKKFDEDRGFLLDELRVIDALDEMSKVEQEEYSKKPTLFNALFIPFIVKKRLLDSELVVVMIENKPGEIYYDVGDEPNDITILASYGSASKLTVDEQRKAIIEQRRAIIEKSKDKNEVVRRKCKKK